MAELCLGQDPQIGLRALAVHNFSVPLAAARRSRSILKSALPARKVAVTCCYGRLMVTGDVGTEELFRLVSKTLLPAPRQVRQ